MAAHAVGQASETGVRVSVIIPARNEAAYITAALVSVAAQSYPVQRIDCVVVDNASTDGTAEAVSEFRQAYPDVDISVVPEPQISVGQAKNRGVTVAKGDIVVFLDADSRMDSTLIADIVRHHSAGSPAGSIRIVADSDDVLERGFFDVLELGKYLFGIRAQMMYCERPLFLALDGFRTDLRQAEDLEFLRRVRTRLQASGRGSVCHVRSSAIATSPRRLQGGRFRRNLIATFIRWSLASLGVGRRWEY